MMRRWSTAFLFWFLPLAVSCGGEAPRPLAAGLEVWTLPRPAGGEIVAEVDGEPVSVQEVAAIARDRKMTPEQALQAAIDERLILRDAELRHGAKFVSQAFKAAAVERLIRERFERSGKAQEIQDSELIEIYNEIQKKDFSPPPFSGRKFHFSHGQWRESSQLIVKTTEKHDEETVAAVDSLLRLVRDSYQVSRDASEEAFRNEAWVVQNTYVPVSFEKLPPLSMDNQENFDRFNGEFDEGFLRELFALPGEGAVSDVFGTKFGRHWVYLVRIEPERRLSFEEAREELRAMVSEGWMVQRFDEWIQQLRASYGVRVKGRGN